jgi:hypothetical protein
LFSSFLAPDRRAVDPNIGLTGLGYGNMSKKTIALA